MMMMMIPYLFYQYKHYCIRRLFTIATRNSNSNHNSNDQLATVL